MNADGYNLLKEALTELDVEIIPEPGEGEDVPYVTIVSPERLVGATVLNALDVAGIGESRELMRRDEGELELKLTSQTETMMTFKDEAAQV